MFFRTWCDLLSFQFTRAFVYGFLAYIFFLLFVIGSIAVSSSF